MTEKDQTAMSGTCSKQDCTAATTGKCLDSYESLADCPHFSLPESTVPSDENEAEEAGERVSVVVEPDQPNASSKIGRKFHPGSELGIEDAAEVMRSRYSHLLGIIGQTDAGKTAFLSALYLMSAQGLLRPHYSFAGSLTLQGFEDRVRRVRRWDKSGLQKQFMVHTELSDPRSPSFMHLSMQEGCGLKRRVELLMTDLPGEWTTELINRVATATRFRFLARADAVVYVLDGPLIADLTSQHQELHKARLMLERLRKTPLVALDTPLVLLITKCDEIGMAAPVNLSEIISEATKLAFQPQVILSSCFSRTPRVVASGTGVKEVIDFVLGTHASQRRGTDDVPEVISGSRAFARFRQG